MNQIEKCMEHERGIAALEADNKTNMTNISRLTSIVEEMSRSTSLLIKAVDLLQASSDAHDSDIASLNSKSNFLRGAFWSLSIAGGIVVGLSGIALAIHELGFIRITH